MYSREFLGNEPGGVTASQTKKKKEKDKDSTCSTHFPSLTFESEGRNKKRLSLQSAFNYKYTLRITLDLLFRKNIYYNFR